MFPSVRHPKRARAPVLQTWLTRAAVFWSASDLAELWIASERELVGMRLGGRVPENASSKAGASASTPNLADEGGCVLECFRLGGALDRVGAGTRGNAAGRTCSRKHVIQSGRERQHSKLGWRGGCVLECFRLGGALDRVGAGIRGSGWERGFPSVRHPERARAPAFQTWVTGRLCFGVLPTWWSFGLRRNGNSWGRLGARVPERASSRAGASASTPNLGGRAAVFWSASDLAELWIASERELVGMRLGGRVPENASSKAGASASTPNLGDGAAMFWSASDLAELWIASERELATAKIGRATNPQ